jgi:hypothetical protein
MRHGKAKSPSEFKSKRAFLLPAAGMIQGFQYQPMSLPLSRVLMKKCNISAAM